MRCFVAIDLPGDVAATVVRAGMRVRTAAPGADVRWNDRDQLHVTLKFLGTVADDRIPAVSRALESAGERTSPVAVKVAGLGAFPALRRARVLWAGITTGGPELASLAQSVDGALAPLGFPAETRRFSAHVTIGRVRSPRRARALAQAVEAAGAGDFGSWTASEVVLYESRLRPTGALYVAVSRHPLRGGRP